jgi:UDPglucose 6-dehydrogenase
MSHSPSLALIRALIAEEVRVCAHDPFAGKNLESIFPDIAVVSDPYEAAREADALMILTEAEAFRRLDWKRIRNSMARPVLLDGRNLLDPSEMRSLGFEYHGIGRS